MCWDYLDSTHSVPAMEFDVDTVDRLLSTTRAVCRRLDLTRPVPREVIQSVLSWPPGRSTAAEARTGGGWWSPTPSGAGPSPTPARQGDVEFLRAEETTSATHGGFSAPLDLVDEFDGRLDALRNWNEDKTVDPAERREARALGQPGPFDQHTVGDGRHGSRPTSMRGSGWSSVGRSSGRAAPPALNGSATPEGGWALLEGGGGVCV